MFVCQRVSDRVDPDYVFMSSPKDELINGMQNKLKQHSPDEGVIYEIAIKPVYIYVCRIAPEFSTQCR